MREIISIKNMIEKAIEKSNTLKISMIKGFWKNICEDLSLKSEPINLKDGLLYIVVENSVYLHAMNMRKRVYIEKINKFLKGEYIFDINYRVRKIDISEKIKRGEGFLFEQQEKKVINYKTDKMSIEESIKYLSFLSKKREEILLKKGYKRCQMCNKIIDSREKLCSKCRGEEEKLTINKY